MAIAKKNFSVIGKSLPRVDSGDKCTGRTKYADDLTRPRMLFGKILTSTHPHALITKLDTSKAEALPGVFGVITGKDLPIQFGIMPVSQDENALAVKKVRYVGEPVAAIAAIDEDIAEEAIALIEIEYEPLKAIMSIEDAINTQEPRIHDYGPEGNLHKVVSTDFGDVDGGFEEADHVREDTYFFQGNTHMPMEQHAAIAEWNPTEEKITMWSATQTPHYVHRALAKVLELPEHKVRVIAAPVGGGFGGKDDPFSHEIAACKLSMMIGRPVKITLTREEVFYAHRGRHPVLMWVKTGVKNDGTITAMHFKSFLDGGAYGSYGPASIYYTGAVQTVTYRIPNYRFQSIRAFTNKPACGPKRAHGTPQPRFAIELQLDKIAEDIGLDPIEIRRKNLTGENHITVNWLKVGSNGSEECMDKVIEASDWKNKFGKLPGGKGIGFALSTYICGAGLPIYWNELPQSMVQIQVDRSGLVTAFSGAIDIGQGSDTVLASLVAEVLGIFQEDVSLVTADTDLTPIDLGTYSSRVTMMMGHAAIQAAEKVKDQLFAAAAEELDVAVERLDARERKIFDSENTDNSISFQEVAKLAEIKFGLIGAVGSYKPAEKLGKYKGSGVGPSPAYSFSTCVAEVDCDAETGDIVVEKIWIAHDIGRALNPLSVIGQVEGSVYMGLGEVLMEEQEYRKNQHKIPSMLDYKSLTFKEMPPVETILVETDEPNAPFGAKEAGQGPLSPVIPAIASAVYNALGVIIDETPVTAEKILKALAEKEKGNLPRVGPKSVPDYDFPEPYPVEIPEEWKK